MPKYKTLTLQQKFCLIQEANKAACSKTELAERHSMSLSMLSTILKNKLKVLLEAYGKTHLSSGHKYGLPHTKMWSLLYFAGCRKQTQSTFLSMEQYCGRRPTTWLYNLGMKSSSAAMNALAVLRNEII